MSEPLRILHVFARMDRGGAETMLMNIYRAIDREQLQFDFVVSSQGEICDYDEEIRALGGKIYYLPRYHGKNHFAYLRAWRQFFQSHPEYAIVHGHLRSTAALYLPIAKKRGLTTICHSHSISSGSGFPALVKTLLQWPLRWLPDWYFACSKEAGAWLFGKKALQKPRFRLIKNAISTEKFAFDDTKRAALREAFDVENQFVIGHVGNFTAAKNQLFAVQVMHEVVKKQPNACLLFIGEGQARAQVEELAATLGLADHIRFLGKREDTWTLYTMMDYFLFPSKFEGLGMALIEAQAAGLVCLTSDQVPREVDLTSRVAFFPLTLSAQQWAAQILQDQSKITENRTLFAKEVAEKGYDITQVAADLQHFYLQECKV